MLMLKDKKSLHLYSVIGIVVVKLCRSDATESHMIRIKEMVELTP